MKKNSLFLFTVLMLIGACSPRHEVNPPAVFEIVADKLDVPAIIQVKSHWEKTNVSVYQWENRLVLFGIFDDLQKTKEKLAQLYPDASIRLYDKAFYEFNRKQCGNQNRADEWDEVVMTANLVSDTTLQQEYMDYHARQQELFPEVAQGFCNADFQRLLIFRQERQLMLIISIPKGKTLDELNPKTTENNPRVDEWNTIMSKYQEGIEGTAPGETWVVFKKPPKT